MATGGRTRWNPAEEERLLRSANGPVGRHLRRCGERVTQEQKRLAAVSPDGSHGRPSGYMRSRVGMEMGRDAAGLFVDVGTDATTPDGHPYPLDVELGTRPHVIRSHGDYPLRDKHGNVFGREVNHPGTPAQPFIRPSLDVLRNE